MHVCLCICIMYMSIVVLLDLRHAKVMGWREECLSVHVVGALDSRCMRYEFLCMIRYANLYYRYSCMCVLL
jgi:hypothetical protein